MKTLLISATLILMLFGCNHKVKIVHTKCPPIPLSPDNVTDTKARRYYEDVIKIHNNYNKKNEK